MVVNRGAVPEVPLAGFERRFPSADGSIPLLRLSLRADRGWFGPRNACVPRMRKLLTSLFLLVAPLAPRPGTSPANGPAPWT